MSGSRMDRLERALVTDRHVPLALVVKRRKTGEVLVRWGGRWDRITRSFVGRSDLCRTVELEESQIEALEFFVEWMSQRERGERRVIVVFVGGARRGGKSYVSVVDAVGFAVHVPGAVIAIVSPTFGKRDQLERQLRALVPSSWGEFHGMPEPRLTLANGSEIRLLGANDPTTLKRGRLDLLLLDDAQDMTLDALSMGLPGIVDGGGLALVAANPPRRFKGEWVLKLRQAVTEGRVEDIHVIDVDASRNEQIDHGTRAAVGRVLAAVDPKAAKADDLGLWLPTGDHVYLEHIDDARNFVPAPDDGDITGEFTRRLSGRSYPTIAGADFQSTPHHAVVVLRVFGTVERPIFHAVEEVLTPAIGSPHSNAFEEELLADVETAGYAPESLLWIGDASGQQQDGAHSGPSRTSYSVIQSWRYRILPPVEKRSDKGVWSKNPPIEDRINTMNKLLSEGRFLIDPIGCPWLAESIKGCPMKTVNGRRKPYGKHAHVTDAVGYALYWAEPKPRAPSTPPTRADIIAIPRINTSGRYRSL